MLITFLFWVSAANAQGWSPASDPKNFGQNYNPTFSELPLEATLPESLLPWSGPFWKDRQGSISYDWQQEKGSWSLPLPSEAEVKALSAEQIEALPPSVKFDIARNRYDYPIFKATEKYAGKPRFSQRLNPLWHAWYGICDGLAQASLHYKNPYPASITNALGKEIRFGSGDLKALAAYYYAYVAVVETPSTEFPVRRDDRVRKRIGENCFPNSPKFPTKPREADSDETGTEPEATCGRDLNPGALHIALTNRIGFEKQGFIADFSPGETINQHPVYGFSTTVLAERPPGLGSAAFTVREIRVKTTLKFAFYDRAHWDRTPTVEKTRSLGYWLELDQSGNIIGGSYDPHGSGKVPDYIWTSEPLVFGHGFEILNHLMRMRQTPSRPSP
ncbi:MAG: hypothetical protein H7301_08445 [Cryobacterium sp.]|nr:hypothetical protein [Oligoflexia bacterium]